MASNTKNVKLGVCKAFFDGIDLGYTQGGVEVTVKTDTHKVNIDQFGKTSINEYIMGRECSVKVPMAETTIDNMVTIMPGATIAEVGGTVASATITLSGIPAANDTVTVNGATYTFVAVPANAHQVSFDTSAANAALNLQKVLTASTDPSSSIAQYSVAGAVVTVKYGSGYVYPTGKTGIEGNSFTLAKTSTAITLSTAALAGGVDPTARSVSVTTGIGTDLLSIAKELRLRPVSKYVNNIFNGDTSEDFVIPLTASAGALKFSYKLENERIFDVDFTGYPDPTTGKLFGIGI